MSRRRRSSEQPEVAPRDAGGTAWNWPNQQVVRADHSGPGVGMTEDTRTPYDIVVDADAPISHWKLGAASAPDRKGVTNWIPAGVAAEIGVVPGLVQRNGGDPASDIAQGGYNDSQIAELTRGIPYDTATWTLEIWLKRTGTFEGYVYRRRGSGQLYLYENGMVDVEFDAGGVQEVDSTINLAVGSVYHLAGVWDGTHLILYINGAENNRITPANPPLTGQVRWAPELIESDLVADEAAWYGSALSAGRVLAHYQAGT